MGQIRRNLGAFTFAALLAMGGAFVPATVEAKPKGGNVSPSEFCAALQGAITDASALPDGPIKDLLLGTLQGAYNAFCQ